MNDCVISHFFVQIMMQHQISQEQNKIWIEATYELRRGSKKKKKLRVRELNPGHPRDRRVY